MKQLIFFTLLSSFMIIVLSNCKKDKKPCACGVEDPQVNIEWLNNTLSRSFCAEIYLYKYNGQEFIGIHDCPGVDAGFVIYNCDGSFFCQYIGLNASCDCPPGFLDNAQKIFVYKQND